MAEQASLGIIIVNWNSGNQLRECLASISATSQEGFRLSRIIVLDNGSKDGSIDDVENADLPLTLIRNQENRGFAAACRQGAEEIDTDYLLFLNPDTQLFVDSLSRPLSFMQRAENSQVGICGVQLLDEEGQVARTCARFPTWRLFYSKMLGLDKLSPRLFPSHFMTEWDHRQSQVVDHVMGAFFLVRRSIWDALGGFDERFFVYLEDMDFSYRARQDGWLSFYLADAQIFHKGGGVSEQIKARRLFYSLRSRILYGYKHFGPLAATGLMVGILVLEPFNRLVFGVIRHSFKEILYTLQGYIMLWRAVPQMLKVAWTKTQQ